MSPFLMIRRLPGQVKADVVSSQLNGSDTVWMEFNRTVFRQCGPNNFHSAFAVFSGNSIE